MPTVPELKAMAKARGIKGFSKMLKGELEAALAAAAPARPAAAPMSPGLAAALAAAAALPSHGAYEEAYAPVARPAAAPKKDDRPFAKAPGVASAIDKLRAVEAATQRRNTMRQVEALDKEITRLTALKGELEAALARPAAAAAAAAAASARAREDARYADADARRLAKEREIKALADSGAPVGKIKDKIVAEYVPLWKASAPVLEMGDMLDDFLDEVAQLRGVSPMFLGTFRKSVRDRITY